jgi:hypothetical protein
VPFPAWSGPEGSTKLRLTDFMATAKGGGKVVSLTHWSHCCIVCQHGLYYCFVLNISFMCIAICLLQLYSLCYAGQGNSSKAGDTLSSRHVSSRDVTSAFGIFNIEFWRTLTLLSLWLRHVIWRGALVGSHASTPLKFLLAHTFRETSRELTWSEDNVSPALREWRPECVTGCLFGWLNKLLVM